MAISKPFCGSKRHWGVGAERVGWRGWQIGTPASSHGLKRASLSGRSRRRSVCTIRPYRGLALGVLREPIQVVPCEGRKARAKVEGESWHRNQYR